MYLQAYNPKKHPAIRKYFVSCRMSDTFLYIMYNIYYIYDNQIGISNAEPMIS